MLLAVIVEGDSLRLWDTVEQRQVSDFAGFGNVVSVALIPDGRLLAWVDWENHLRIWGVDTKSEVCDLSADELGVLMSVAFSPDGRLLAAGGAGLIHLWDTATWTRTQVLKAEHSDLISRATFSRDGRRLVGNGTCVWDIEDGRLLRTLADADDDFAVSPEGDMVALVAGQVTLLDTFTGAQRSVFEHPDGVTSADFSPDGTILATGGDDGVVRLWDIETASLGRSLEGHDGEVSCVCFAPDGLVLFSGGADGSVRFWDPESGRELGRFDQGGPVSTLSLPCGPPLGVHRVRISPTVDCDATIRRVRQQFVFGPMRGLYEWFKVFDEHAHGMQADHCEALVEELRSEDYPLDAEDSRFVTSREGVVQLLRGALHHLAGELDEAEACYRQSGEIQRSVGCGPADGQVLIMLTMLADSRRGCDVDAEIREELRAIPVLGSGTALLTQRLHRGTLSEQREAVAVALEAGAAATLVEGLRAKDASVRAIAAAGLVRLDFAPVLAEVLSALGDSHWFVRWRIVELLGDSRLPSQDARTALESALAHETDPEVRRAIVRSLGKIGDHASTPALARALGDGDVEVRSAALAALVYCGDRRALGPLSIVRSGRDLLFNDLAEHARRAESTIRARLPIPVVKKVLPLRRRGEAFEPAHLFWTDEEIVISFSLTGDALVRVNVRDPSGQIVWTERAQYSDLVARVLSSPGASEDAQTLVEVVDDDTGEGQMIRLGERVRLLPGLPDMGQLVVGDTGTVRVVRSPRGSVGIEWDRHIDGHELSGDGGCRPGHGWWVNPRYVAIETGSRSLQAARVRWQSPSEVGRAAGIYRAEVEVLDESTGVYEGLLSVDVEIIGQVEVQSVVVVSAVGREIPTEVVLAGTDATCRVLLGNAPKGTMVSFSSLNPMPPGGEAVAVVVSTPKEGEQAVSLAWRVSWPNEPCPLVIAVQGRPAKEVSLTVVPAVAICGVALCHEVDHDLLPRRFAGRFSAAQETIYCIVELTQAPAATRIVAVFEYIDRGVHRILDCTAQTERSGAQPVAFALTRPSQGWLPGRYRVRTAVLTPDESSRVEGDGELESEWAFVEAARWTTVTFQVEGTAFGTPAGTQD